MSPINNAVPFTSRTARQHHHCSADPQLQYFPQAFRESINVQQAGLFPRSEVVQMKVGVLRGFQRKKEKKSKSAHVKAKYGNQ